MVVKALSILYFANDGPLPIQMVEQYSAVGSEPVALDTKKLQAKGIRTIRATLISPKSPLFMILNG